MARDLLTPDEVKQLHYKTIIFPIIGYPVFRDTVIYSKFDCYKEGEIDREIKSLKNLDYTYFTVEQIKSPFGNRFKKIDNDLEHEEKDFFKEQREEEEKILLKAIEQIQSVVKNEKLDFEYKEKNNRTYSVVTLEKPLNKFETKMINGKVDNNVYHIEISNNVDGKNIIEIHLKNIYENTLDLEKGKKE